MIHVFDRFAAEGFYPHSKTLAIRCMSSLLVMTQRNIEYGQLDRKLYVGILPLTFDDITLEDRELNPGTYDNHVLFEDKHAQEISNFLKKYAGKFEDIMVHCDMGSSRSCAVGVSIGDHFGMEYSPDILERERGPNPHVRDVLDNRLVLDFPRRVVGQ